MSQSRAVVITEASSPVGLATAARLAAGGDLVLMGTRRPDICEQFAAELRSDSAAAFAAYLDLADPLSIDRFVKSADYLIGTVDVLVSAAGLADGWGFGAQHFAAQVIPPMIDRGCGDVVLISPELIGPATATAGGILEAWVAGLEAEFVGTGVRASIVRSTAAGNVHVPPGDVGCLIATVLGSPGMHLRVVDIIAPLPAASISALTD